MNIIGSLLMQVREKTAELFGLKPVDSPLPRTEEDLLREETWKLQEEYQKLLEVSPTLLRRMCSVPAQAETPYEANKRVAGISVPSSKEPQAPELYEACWQGGRCQTGAPGRPSRIR